MGNNTSIVEFNDIENIIKLSMKIESHDIENHGLKIGDLKIKKLSGPMSIRILKPKSEENNLPIIILFGDNHISKNPCYPCNNDKGCYDISDDNFLSSVNSFCEKYNIKFDVYLEYTDFVEYESESHISKLSNKVRNCFRIKDKKYDNCKYKYIRWHYSEIRDISNKNEFMETSGKIKKIFNNIMIKNFSSQTYIYNCTKFVDDIFEEIQKSKEKSLLWKQIIKGIYDFKYWKVIFLKMFLNDSMNEKYVELQKEFKKNKEAEELWIHFNNYNKFIELKNKLDKNIKQIQKEIFFRFETYLLDLYFLTRVFKTTIFWRISL